MKPRLVVAVTESVLLSSGNGGNCKVNSSREFLLSVYYMTDAKLSAFFESSH